MWLRHFSEIYITPLCKVITTLQYSSECEWDISVRYITPLLSLISWIFMFSLISVFIIWMVNVVHVNNVTGITKSMYWRLTQAESGKKHPAHHIPAGHIFFHIHTCDKLTVTPCGILDKWIPYTGDPLNKRVGSWHSVFLHILLRHIFFILPE